MAVRVQKLKGTLKLGATADQLDLSCQAESVTLDPNKSSEDSTTVLCGDVVPGASAYAWNLSATLLLDLSSGGLVEWLFTHRGETAAFEFVPSSAVGTAFAGMLVVDPIAVGGDAGANMSQDVEWAIVGDPVPIWAERTATFPSPTTFPDTKTWPTPFAPTKTKAK